MKRFLILCLIVTLLAGCSAVSEKEMNRKAVNPNLDIKIPCKSAEWEALTTVEEGKKITQVKSRVYYREGRFRLEILGPQEGDKQVILMDEKKLYVLGHDNKAYMYDADRRDCEVFLRRIFVNTGLGRKAEIRSGYGSYNGGKCAVYEYEMLRSVNGLYAKTIVKEWRDKKGATVKMEAVVGPAEFSISGSRLVVGPIRETYEVSNYKCGKMLMGVLFEVPVGMQVINQQDIYMKEMKKSGKEPGAAPEFVTITVKPKKK